MARPKKSKPTESSDAGSGEAFSNVSDSDLSGSESESSAGDYEVQIPQGNWEVPILGAKAQRTEYEQALKDAQLKMNELQMLVRTLSARNADLTLRVGKLKKSRSTNASTSSSAPAKKGTKAKLPEGDQCISQAAKHFGVMHETFIPHSAFLVPAPALRSTDSGRYKSEDTKIQGITAELYEVLSADLHKRIAGDVDFRALFMKQLNAGRRTIIHRLRTTTGPDIFSQSAKLYQHKHERSNIEAFRRELMFENETKYSKYAPILFPKVETEPGKFVHQRDMKFLFRNIELTKMLKSILFGTSSITSDKIASNSQGTAWGVKFVTPGAIALMAILAIFLHSPDYEFASVGARSQIPYEKWFNNFKAFLMANAAKENIRDLYMWWNRQVFPAHRRDKTTGGADLVKDDSSGMEEAQLGLCSAKADDSGLEFELKSMQPSKPVIQDKNLAARFDDALMFDDSMSTLSSDSEWNAPKPGELHASSLLPGHIADSQILPGRPAPRLQSVEHILKDSLKPKKPVALKVNSKDKKGKARATGSAATDDAPKVNTAQEHVDAALVTGRKMTRSRSKNVLLHFHFHFCHFHATVPRFENIYFFHLNVASSAQVQFPSKSPLTLVAESVPKDSQSTPTHNVLLLNVLKHFASSYLASTFDSETRKINRARRIFPSCRCIASTESLFHIIPARVGSPRCGNFWQGLRIRAFRRPENERGLYNIYKPFVMPFVQTVTENGLVPLAEEESESTFYTSGLDVVSWLPGAISRPPVTYLASVPVSFPLIGLTQLAQYLVVTFKAALLALPDIRKASFRL
ncbi:hypothetical protein BJ912DRAFT_935489 [Pholiota molesta]|nr:hypothetical protein BJ912DRAFT_935489 [Pholiota molesta]